MKIIYDLRYASEHFPGVGTFAYALFAALVEAPGLDRYVALWDVAHGSSRFDLSRLADHPRIEWCDTPDPPLGWQAPLTTGARLRRIAGDVYLSPFYLRPVGAPMPVVLTMHDALHLAPESGSPWPMRTRFAMAMHHAKGANALLTWSVASADDLVRRIGVQPERLHVIRHGVPPRSAMPMARPDGVPDRPFALVVGVNRPHKNHALLARVWEGFATSAPLDLVAAGPIDPRFPSLRQLAPREKVHVLDAVSGGQLEWLYAHAIVLVFPTRHEGFGLPVLEAADRGLPVIASDLPVMREAGGDAVRYVAVDDVSGWMSAIREVASEASMRSRMIAAGRAHAARFSYADSAARVRQVLADVVAGAPA